MRSLRVSSLLSLVSALVLSVSLVPALTANAQDTCFGLSADDCALAKAASSPEAYAKLTSFTFTQVSQVSNTTNGVTNGVNVNGGGAYASDKPFLVSTTATASPDENITLQYSIDITSVKAGVAGTPRHTEVRITGGTVYFFAANRWLSSPLKDSTTGNPLLAGIGNPRLFTDTLRQTFQLLAGAGIVQAKRGPDVTIDNAQVAAFVYTFDIPKAISDANGQMAFTLLKGNFPFLATLTADDIKSKSAQLAQLFKNTTLTVTRYVGVNDKLPHGAAVDVTANLDPKDMAAFPPAAGAGSSTPPATNQPIVITEHFEYKVGAIGSPVTVAVPDKVVPMPKIPLPPNATQPAAQ